MNVYGLKISFFVIVLIGAILTIAALLTPSWRYLDETGFYNQGLLTNHADKSRDSFEKWSIASIVLAILVEIAILILAILGFVKSSNACLYCGVSVLTFVTDLFLILAIIIYGTNYKDGSHGYHIDFPQDGDNSPPQIVKTYYTLGYSFWLLILALGFTCFSTILGLMTGILIKKSRRYT